MSPSEIKEKLLATWLHEKPSELCIAGRPSWLTAEHNGVKLYTTLGKTMTRDAPFMPYREVDGVHYHFVNQDGKSCWGFDCQSSPSASMQATFEYFAKKYGDDLSKADWLVDKAVQQKGVQKSINGCASLTDAQDDQSVDDQDGMRVF